MRSDQREYTFLVRIRLLDETGDSQWRGSVHEVSSGKRRFVSGARDVVEFITSYLRDGHVVYDAGAILHAGAELPPAAILRPGQAAQIFPPHALAPLFDDAPLYERPFTRPAKAHRLAPDETPAPTDYAEALIKLMSCPDMASKRWLWEQYDRHVE